MDVKDLIVAKEQLEMEVFKAVSDLVEKFKEEQGVSPASIYINTVVEQSLGSRTKEMIVVDCSISIEL